MTLTHRRHESKLSNGYVVLFCEDEQRNSHYGRHIWTLKTELPQASKCADLIAFAADYYDVTEDEALALVNQDDIVSTAGAWDDPQFVAELWQAMEYKKVAMVPGYRTYDGAVVMDRAAVELEYHEDTEEL